MYEASQGVQQGSRSSVGPNRNMGAPTPSASIAAALDGNDQLLADLHGAISQMADRLTLVLSPDQPPGNAVGKDVGSPQIVNRVALQGAAIAVATQRLEHLIQRVQL